MTPKPAVIQRNKLNEGSDRRAEFDFYQKETPEHPIGIDTSKDVLNTAIRTRVIQKSGGWFGHPTFGEKTINGREAVYELLADKPEAVEQIRGEVLEVMFKKIEEKANGTEGK
jgi:hypothetical protein